MKSLNDEIKRLGTDDVRITKRPRCDWSATIRLPDGAWAVGDGHSPSAALAAAIEDARRS